MRRRILLDVEVVDAVPGAMLSLLTELAGWLEDLKRADVLVDYGLALEHDVSWVVKIAAQAPEPEEPGHGAAEEIQGSTN